MGGQQFFQGLASKEAARLRQSLRMALDQSSPVELRSLTEQIIAEYSVLSARVHVLELALEAGMASPDSFENDPPLVASFAHDAAHLASQSDTLDLEKDSQLGSFCWTITKSWVLTLPVLRFKPRRLRIFFADIIKPEYAKSLNILIDGVVLRHRVVKFEGTRYLELVIPPSNAIAPSYLELALPDIHSPMELGQSHDKRHLGIALSGLVIDDVPRALAIRWHLRL